MPIKGQFHSLQGGQPFYNPGQKDRVVITDLDFQGCSESLGGVSDLKTEGVQGTAALLGEGGWTEKTNWISLWWGWDTVSRHWSRLYPLKGRAVISSRETQRQHGPYLQGDQLWLLLFWGRGEGGVWASRIAVVSESPESFCGLTKTWISPVLTHFCAPPPHLSPPSQKFQPSLLGPTCLGNP